MRADPRADHARHLPRGERIGSWIFVVAAVLASGALFALALKLLPIYRDLDHRVPLLA